MVREMAYQMAQDGKFVKICIQGSMGEGVFQALPLSLNGVSKIMLAMDWGDIVDFVSFGEIKAEDVDQADVYLFLCPQNIVAGNVMGNLEEMVCPVQSSRPRACYLTEQFLFNTLTSSCNS